MKFLRQCGFAILFTTVAVLASGPTASAQCQGGECINGEVDYTAQYYSCGGSCGGEFAMVVVNEYDNEQTFFPDAVTGYCCGHPVCAPWVPTQYECPIQTRPSSASQEEPSLRPGESVFLFRQCDGSYAAINLGAAG